MEHGIITATRYEKGVVLCNVQAIRVDTEYEDVPMLKPFDGFSVVPHIGQKVTMTALGDGTRFITQVLGRRPEGERPESLEAGELSIQLDPETKLTFTKTDDETYNVDISASGNVNVTASGDATVKTDDGYGLRVDQTGHVQVNASSFDIDTQGGTFS